jgi:trehalose-6-phosphatase
MALMSEAAREAVRRVAQLFPTAVISGRGREKVQQFVRLRELYYAGSHGMDIVGPSVHSTADGDDGSDGGAAASALAFQPAAAYAPLVDAVHGELEAGVAAIPGAAVEHNKFCVSVHFRNCAPEHYPAGRRLGAAGGGGDAPARCHAATPMSPQREGQLWVLPPPAGWHPPGPLRPSPPPTHPSHDARAPPANPSLLPPTPPLPPAVVGVVEGVAAAHPELRITRGRKVLEVRPQVDWDKGAALTHLLAMLGLDDPDSVYCLYLGDDRTDEDAFSGGRLLYVWVWLLFSGGGGGRGAP